MVKVHLTRDSVCAGDDTDAPHEQSAEFDPAELQIESSHIGWLGVRAFIEKMSRGYLPSVNGVGHCWSAFLNGKFVATVTTKNNWSFVEELDLKAENELYFKYHPAKY